jgi:hypothetical protein
MRRKNKYNAQKTVVNGKICDSKLEAKHYNTLLMCEKAGKIKDLILHPRFPIKVLGKKICTVVLDFQFYDNQLNEMRYIDVKGVYTGESKLRHKLLEVVEDIKIEIWKK